MYREFIVNAVKIASCHDAKFLVISTRACLYENLWSRIQYKNIVVPVRTGNPIEIVLCPQQVYYWKKLLYTKMGRRCHQSFIHYMNYLCKYVALNRDQSGYGLSQWETTLHCNVVFQWLSLYHIPRMISTEALVIISESYSGTYNAYPPPPPPPLSSSIKTKINFGMYPWYIVGIQWLWSRKNNA